MTTTQGDGPRLLAGGNPQIPKGDGDLDEEQLLNWFEQAAEIPGWAP